MKHPFKIYQTALFILSFFILLGSQNASAGFLDKLTEASQKMQQAANNMNARAQQGGTIGGDPDRPLNLDNYPGHCNGQGGATCLDYMDKVDGCMAPLKGYRSKLTADLIENKLATEQGIYPELRKNLQEDLIAARTAQQAGNDNIISTPSDPQRYLMDISEDDQVTINSQFAPFYQKIMNKCMGADHMGTGHRTEMNYIQEDPNPGPTRTQQRKAFEAHQNCFAQTQGLRWQLMADMMEKKMNALPNLSAQERSEWQADIAAVRATNGATMPTPADPAQPARHLMRLSSEDQLVLGQELSTATKKAIDECTTNVDANSVIQERKPRNTGLVDHTRSPANNGYEQSARPSGYVREKIDPNYVPLFKSGVTPAPIPAGHPQNNSQITEEEMLNTHSKIRKGGSLSASLGATDVSYMKTFSKCADPIKGLRARLIAQVLQYKHDTIKDLSPADRVKYEADIRAAWEASAKGLDNVPSPDPDYPNRPFEWLNSVDQQDLNQEFSRRTQEIMKRCNGKASTMTAFN